MPQKDPLASRDLGSCPRLRSIDGALENGPGGPAGHREKLPISRHNAPGSGGGLRSAQTAVRFKSHRQRWSGSAAPGVNAQWCLRNRIPATSGGPLRTTAVITRLRTGSPGGAQIA